MSYMLFSGWYRGEKRSMKFAVPRVWREPTNHYDDCYFCIVDPTSRRGRKRVEISYPSIPSSIAPVPHSTDLPVPKPPSQSVVSSEQSTSSTDDSDVSFLEDAKTNRQPYFPTQEDLNDLIKDLGLTKSNAELLTSRLKQWNLVHDSVKVSGQRKRHQAFSSFFTKVEGLCYCKDVIGLFKAIGIPFSVCEWRLFIDSSSKSLKAVLLHNGNTFPSLPLAHAVHMKEDYINVKTLLDKLKYSEYKWELIGDFKMVGFLMGLQGGFTKFPCYLCLWDSRDTSSHYRQQPWPQRAGFDIGRENVKYKPLVDPKKILMPPLHIKLGLMKQFVKALDRESRAFDFLKEKFPRLSEAKITAGIFDGPQIKQVMKSVDFPKLLQRKEKSAWKSFVAVVEGFLGNHRADNYEVLVSNLVDRYHTMGCRMSLKVHMLHSHLDKFKDNLGAYSEEQGERFHQDILDFEHRYQGQYNENMMGDYVWGLIRETDTPHRRKSRRMSHF